MVKWYMCSSLDAQCRYVRGVRLDASSSGPPYAGLLSMLSLCWAPFFMRLI